MPRPGTSGGGHRSSGGHSSSRVGGGHHVGSSSRRPTGGSYLIEDHLLEVAITMNPHHQDHREEVIMVIVEILIHTHRVA